MGKKKKKCCPCPPGPEGPSATADTEGTASAGQTSTAPVDTPLVGGRVVFSEENGTAKLITVKPGHVIPISEENVPSGSKIECKNNICEVLEEGEGRYSICFGVRADVACGGGEPRVGLAIFSGDAPDRFDSSYYCGRVLQGLDDAWMSTTILKDLHVGDKIAIVNAGSKLHLGSSQPCDLLSNLTLVRLGPIPAEAAPSPAPVKVRAATPAKKVRAPAPSPSARRRYPARMRR